ncbi:dipeptide epimerase [Gynurincola endophyticus]|jgi:L-alanine-DL-glutamate epimerase-like enolase superfamily enzyme|uniref:dipeptide epimerase n=1 Tax=Gynurincola endophyticus TaxID=2479004 RepID=UPI000F8CD399|nr:dipeptide epimerase [Gynurincola endophyticus]
MKLAYRIVELRRKYPFTISGHTTVADNVIYITLEHDGVIGYGEGCPGYYFSETLEDELKFLSKLKLEQFNNPTDIETILSYVDGVEAGHTAAKAGVDIALHDLVGKLTGLPCYKLFNSDPAKMPETTLTIGMDTPDMIRKKVLEAEGFHLLKVKLGGDNDKAIIETIRSVSDLPLTVDANQGWHNKEEALEMIHWLKERNTIFIEQPMPREQRDNNAWITEHSPLPTVGDEAVQRLADVDQAKGVYTGINIKMVKCTGMHEGYKMILRARELGLKLMVGCMGESSVAILGAAAIAPQCDWVDLDSTWLISNNPYKDPVLENGKIILNDQPGLGLQQL